MAWVICAVFMTRRPATSASRTWLRICWAMENNLEGGETFLTRYISIIRGHGGFRSTSPNYVGAEAFRNAADAFKTEGYDLTDEGELRPMLLDNLAGC